MKKLLLIVSLLTALTLVACKSEADKAGEQYASEAFQALKDEFKQDIKIKDADYACSTAVIEERNESTCTYVIRLTTGELDAPYYAFVFVSADEQKTTPFTYVQIYGKESDYNEMLDTIYSDTFQEDTRDQMAEDDTIESFDFVADTLSQDEINDAYEKVE